MKNIQKIFIIALVLQFSIFFNLCNPVSSDDLTPVSFEEIEMECMDMVSMGGNLEVVIDSQDEYNELIYDRFLKPLENYWNTNYASVLEYIKQKNPGLPFEEYEKLVRDIFYSASPFRGTENCTHPQIDFSKYTLLGKDANSGGCDFPEYNIEVKRDNIAREYILRISIRRIGNCEMGIFENKWILIPKLPKGFSVKFVNVELN